MKFKKLQLFTNKLTSEFKFYSEILNLKILEKQHDTFTVQVGWTELKFVASKYEHRYHYCFLIPSNLLHEAAEWLEKRTSIIEIDTDKKTQYFESWNAESLYFFDASGNIAEFIVHYDLNNRQETFDASSLLGICEIGLPTDNIEKTNTEINKLLNFSFWKGDKKRFGSNGCIEAKFLLPNYKVKKTWFPTTLKIKPEPFSVTVEKNNSTYHLDFMDGIIKMNNESTSLKT